MAILRVKCDCGKIVESNVGDRLCDNKLYWFQSYQCDNCGKIIELDGIEKIPIEIETAIMEQEGRCGLFLNNSKDRRKTEFLLRKQQNSILDKFELFIEKKSDEIAQGTKNEMLYIKNLLKSKGKIDCTIRYY